MQHQALYRKWRPATFDQVYGQDAITSVLKYEIENRRASHAYLFCGSRGTGKTTCAKILARALNCTNLKNGSPCGECESCLLIESGSATDVLEMDAASNTGVDYIRDIREMIAYPPARLAMRVYIIDEVHMLSNSAFNALLKTLEEPPKQVTFILATTEPHKIPATILSRLQRFDFRRIPQEVIAEHLHRIADAEGIELTDDAASLIARIAQGGMRDAIALLELCSASGGKVTADRVTEISGVADKSTVYAAIDAVIRADVGEIFALVAKLYQSSMDISVFWNELIAAYRDILVVKCAPGAVSVLDATDAELTRLGYFAGAMSVDTIIYHTKMLDDGLAAMGGGRTTQARRLTAELTLVRMTNPQLSPSYEALADRVSRLEAAITGGALTPQVTPPMKRSEPADAPAPAMPGAEQTTAPDAAPRDNRTNTPAGTMMSSNTQNAHAGGTDDRRYAGGGRQDSPTGQNPTQTSTDAGSTNTPVGTMMSSNTQNAHAGGTDDRRFAGAGRQASPTGQNPTQTSTDADSTNTPAGRQASSTTQNPTPAAHTIGGSPAAAHAPGGTPAAAHTTGGSPAELKRMRFFAEAIKPLEAANPPAYSFLGHMRAYLDEARGKVIIRTADSFPLIVADTPEVRQALVNGISRCGGFTVSPSDIIFEVSEAESEDNDPLDDLSD